MHNKIAKWGLTGLSGMVALGLCCCAKPATGAESEKKPVLAATASVSEIHDAVLAHDINRVRQLLLEKPDLVNAVNERGDTPIYIAAFRGYMKQMIPLLLQFGANPSPPPNQRMETPLSIARERNLRQTAEMLIRAGARDDDLSRGAEIRYLTIKRDTKTLTTRLQEFPHLVNARNAFGQTPLTFAVLDGQPDSTTAITLLKLGADPNATNNFGGTPYSMAVDLERTNAVTLLQQHGAKENAVSRSAPLRIAVRKNLLLEAKTLLQEHPEMVNATDDLRRTPLHLACAEAGLPVVGLLLERGADVRALDFGDNTPLHAAATAGKLDLVTALLARQAPVNALNRQRVPPLLNAAATGSTVAVEALLKAGADLKAADNIGETALHRAATGGHVEVMKFLLDRGLDVNVRDRQRQTALHQAAEAGQAEAIKFLLAQKVNPAYTDVSGNTALALAERRKLEEIIKLLRPVSPPSPPAAK